LLLTQNDFARRNALLRSMTGYGGSERTDGDRRIRIDIKSVNQRFLDLQIKAPRLLLPVEDRIRKAVQSRLARGRVTVFVDWRDAGETAVALNPLAARKLVSDLRRLGEELSLPGDVDLRSLSAFPQIFDQDGESREADELWTALEPAVAEALDRLVTMREAEGRELHADLVSRLAAIESIVLGVEEAAPSVTEALREKVLTRIKALVDGAVQVDEARIAQEAAVAAERSDFAEEIVRLKAHVTQARECLASDESSGKRLNFLAQEMHREANTIGSKTSDVDISVTVVTLKEEVERFREQVQNVE
jgi:uncharacterized protein (TIGR00255 family)